MANKPIRFHPEAEAEYLAALAWYRERSRIAATNFEGAVGAAVDRIRKAPDRWPAYFDEFRKYVLREFPFSIVYQGFSDEITIFAVAHGRRRPGYWRSRL